jgi:hypothetical protein
MKSVTRKQDCQRDESNGNVGNPPYTQEMMPRSASKYASSIVNAKQITQFHSLKKNKQSYFDTIYVYIFLFTYLFYGTSFFMWIPL